MTCPKKVGFYFYTRRFLPGLVGGIPGTRHLLPIFRNSISSEFIIRNSTTQLHTYIISLTRIVWRLNWQCILEDTWNMKDPFDASYVYHFFLPSIIGKLITWICLKLCVNWWLLCGTQSIFLIQNVQFCQLLFANQTVLIQLLYQVPVVTCLTIPVTFMILYPIQFYLSVTISQEGLIWIIM